MSAQYIQCKRQTDGDREHITTHRERQVERRFVFGLLWPRISPLQMNINKELLISAACTVREYVCMQGRHRGAVWTSRPPPLASPPSPPLPLNLYLYHFVPPPHTYSDYFLFPMFFAFFLIILFFYLSLASSPQSFFLSTTKDANADAGTGFVII